jgi:hypothetical protein
VAHCRSSCTGIAQDSCGLNGGCALVLWCRRGCVIRVVRAGMQLRGVIGRRYQGTTKTRASAQRSS